MAREREIEIEFTAGVRRVVFNTTFSHIRSTGFKNEVERFVTDAGLGDIAENVANDLVQLVERKIEVTLKKESEISSRGETPRGILDAIPPDTGLSEIMGAGKISKPKKYILVVVVSDTATRAGTSYGLTVCSYIDLLKSKYPDAILETTGCTLRNNQWEWRTQQEFESDIRSANISAKSRYEGFLGFDQVHIVGHGVPGLGLQFADGSGFDPDYLEEGTTGSNLLQLAPGGKVVIAACYAKDGILLNWLRLGFGEDIEAEDIDEKSRVHGVEGDFFVEKSPVDGKPEWDLDESTKGINDFLDRKLEK
jgi:hypothetical protein